MVGTNRLGQYRNQNLFFVDRLIAAANMFDILPASAVPSEIALAPTVVEAKNRCRDIFKKLPKTPERDSVLSALGRLGMSSLRRKIHHRGEPVRNALGARFADLMYVCDQAVVCRNHYVHGSAAACDYRVNFFDTVVFFTDTLEFVFGTSDLLQSGWDMNEWTKRYGGHSHRFGEYLNTYRESLAKLQALLGVSDGAPQ